MLWVLIRIALPRPHNIGFYEDSTKLSLDYHHMRTLSLLLAVDLSLSDLVTLPGFEAHSSLFTCSQIDNVENPSWQAQITGTKKWTLEPPPECYYTCPDRIEVTVQPGQISK